MTNTAGDADRFAAAHAALKADSLVQFNLTAPPPDPETPSWLNDFLKWLEHAWRSSGCLASSTFARTGSRYSKWDRALEEGLRLEQPEAIATVARTIGAKAGLPDDGDDYGFLYDHYAALCAKLESGLLVGRRREMKWEA